MRNYKVTNVLTGEVLLRYGDINQVKDITDMNTSNMAIYCDSGALYKGTYLIEYDYQDELCEDWERTCALLRGEPMRSPKIEFRATTLMLEI